MTVRGLLLFLLGAWCGATVFMWLVATQNFAVATKLLEAPSSDFASAASPLAADNLRLVLRHQASEVNRLMFDGWGLVQVPLAAVALALAWRLRPGKFLLVAIGVMLLITLFLQFYAVPETIRLGRLMDFVPRDPPPPEATAFWRLHGAYTGLDMLKFLLGLGAALMLPRKQASY